MTAPVAPPRDWHGEWIGAGDDGPAAPLLRREVDPPTTAVRAVLHVAGLGLHHTTVNGRPVSDARLESGITAYGHRIIHSGYPVSLTGGPLVVGIELGRGFYAMTTPNVWGWHRAPWRGPRTALVQLEFLDAHGTVVGTVVSDRSWRWSTGGTRFDSLYEGETFDARQHPAGWDAPGFDASGWADVVPVTAPTGVLVPQRHEPIRVTASYPVESWSRSDGGRWIADLGRQLAGWVHLTVPELPEGTRITLRFGERVGPDGVLLDNPHVDSERLDVHEFVVGDDHRSWEPRFTLTGFRYVEVSGITGPDQVELVARHAHNDVTPAGTFSCSDAVLSWIDTAMRSTVVNNLFHLPTDTPVYEKNGWTGDVHVALETMLHQFDLEQLMIKWLDDIADTQTPEGQLAVIAPTPGWGYLEAPEWTMLYPHLLARLDHWYGVPEVVAAHLPALLRYVERELGRRDADGLTHGILGDYLAPGSTGTPPGDDLRIAASCHLVRGLRTTADLVDRVPGAAPGTADRLRTEAEAVADAINATFLDVEAGWYRGPDEPTYRQTSNILPLAFDITPTDHAPRVARRLADALVAHGHRHDAGCLGLSELFGVLTRHGYADLALTVATGRTAPSWGAWMDAGETTMVEMWGPEERSRNHFFMGAMARWLYESVAGVSMVAPQWREFAVDPVARGHLTHAAYHHDGPHGRLGAAWRQDADGFALDVQVPADTRARIHLPDQPPFWVGPGRHAFAVPAEADQVVGV